MIELIRYDLPLYGKHVLAPKNKFGMPKMTWRIYKSFGIRANPPPLCWEKFPKNVVFLQAPLGGWLKKTRHFLGIFPKMGGRGVAQFPKLVLRKL